MKRILLGALCAVTVLALLTGCGKPAASAAMPISIPSHNPIAPQPPPVVRRHLPFLPP